ncbi:MAG TPA: LLM class flavin-dependent oxidoreductase [Nitrososphaerales archaeon]|nr:LLM class flavin-dependent oxidoreductase [Nitrososphaerales archaeon]
MLRLKDSGIMLEPQLGMTMDTLVGSAVLVEDLGFGYFFRSDHILPTDDRRGLDSPECWTSLGAVAASTSKIKFGPMVSPIGFRNPALLAKMACTLHSYSRGRLQLAIGAGWYEPEYRAHGFPFPNFRERVEQFSEALGIINALVQEGRADFDGKYFSAHTDCYPRPHGRVNVIVGARTRPLVKIAAEKGDEWNFFHLPSKDFGELRKVLDASRGGRRVEISEMGPFMIGKSKPELEANAKLHASKMGKDIAPQEVLKRLKDREAPCGTVEEFVEQVRTINDSGVQKIYFQTLTPDNKPMLELLADTLRAI